MSELFFVIKTALFSVLVLLVLQMKLGGSTLEKHSEDWIYHSRAGSEMQSVARGAVKAGYEGWDWVKVQTSSVVRDVKRERHANARPGTDDLD